MPSYIDPAIFKLYVKATDPNIPEIEKPYFIKVMKLVMGMLVIITLILSVIRPTLKALLYEQSNDDTET